FTMAEILLSLTIIGVVAAITLPSLTGNINERTWNTQRKALYARFSQAIALMPALNGYGTVTEATSSASAIDTAAETFITAGLSKVLKINNICDAEHLEDCGIPTKITTATPDNNLVVSNIKNIASFNSMFSAINTNAAAFETANGESILVYYNPKCTADMNQTTGFRVYDKMCVNFVFDLNGSKGPNTFGKDIGLITAFYPSDPVVVAPFPVVRSSTTGTVQVPNLETAQKSCREDFDNARLPNREELMAMAANAPLFGRDDSLSGFGFTSSSTVDSTNVWHVQYGNGAVYPNGKANRSMAWCINR
ncbi:MAG: hypothetical protein NC390_07775, partial [Fusobacterium sp.]|nr:hypothetical protein [Fusobacterium sp.]